MGKTKKIKDGDDNYAAKDEKFDKRRKKREDKDMKTAGIAVAIKKAKKGEKPMNGPKVKAQKK